MVEEKPTIHFVMTGGAIDSFCDGTRDTVVPYQHSVIPKYIKGLKLHEKVEFTEVCMKDSRGLNETDFENILKQSEKVHTIKSLLLTELTSCQILRNT
jgi:L-asparaginase/Glu-tRNA(Gln) amidotransferase subunit D